MTPSPTRTRASGLIAAVAIATIFATAVPVRAQDATPATPTTDAPAAETPKTDAPAPDAPATQGSTETPAQSTNPAPPGGELNVGEALGGGPEIYVKEEHGDWQVRCLRAPEGQTDPCQLYQRLADQQGNPTADVNIFLLPDGGDIAAGATILTPLQTLLTAQVTMAVDSAQPRRYPFSFCDPTGCYSRIGFTTADLAALKRGNAATISVVPALAPDQRAEMKMSLSGFTAGLAAIEPVAPPAQ